MDRTSFRDRSRSWFVVFALALVVIAGPAMREAGASAFNQPAGQGLVIVEGLFDTGSRSYDAHGHLVKTSPYTKREGWAYVEYGLTNWLQVIVKPDLVSTSVGGSPGGHYTGVGTSEAGAQVQLPSFGPFAFALQGTFHLPASRQERNLALVGNTSRDTDGRALAGAVFNLGPWPAFVDAQAGYRVRGAPAPDEMHVDLTGGIRPLPKVLLLVQSFTTVPTQAGSPFFPRSTYSNLGASLVYDIDARWSVQFGGFETIVGRDALRERALQTGVWYRF